MKLKDLAQAAGKSVPFVMTLQQKYGLPTCKEYSDGHLVLIKKLICLSICSVPIKDIRALLKSERRLLELLKVDSLHESSDWFESLCKMNSGPTRLLLSGYDIGSPVSGSTVQAGLDFSKRDKELFSDHEMGANALRGLKRYAETVTPIHRRLKEDLPVLKEAVKWCRRVKLIVDIRGVVGYGSGRGS